MSVEGAVTRAQLARVLGMSAKTVARLEAAGVVEPIAPPKRGTTSRYDLARCVQAVMAHREAQQPVQIDEAKARREAAEARRAEASAEIMELKAAQVRGDLIAVADAERVLIELAGAVRASLLAVGRRAVLAGLPSAHEPLVRRLITEALREFSTATSLQALSGLQRQADVDDAEVA